MEPSIFFIAASVSAAALILNWKFEKVLHNFRIRSIEARIHVNGIRGKSTVTRILAGMLREAHLETMAKTTGSAACLIDRSGRDQPIFRRGAPTILEQIDIIHRLGPGLDALVIECMAIKPSYQKICEEKIIQSNIGILTNVREDHQEVLGWSLEQIARSLMSACPIGGILITSEQNPSLLAEIKSIAEGHQTQLIVADPKTVTDAEVAAFPYLAFRENISVGFAVAAVLGIDRKTALRGMVAAAPDPGVLRIERTEFKNQAIVFADLFAVNDRESVVACVERVEHNLDHDAIKIAILNNRADREHRAIQFARIAAKDLNFDYIALIGAYEKQIERELIKCGFARSRIIFAGEDRGLIGESLVNHLMPHELGRDVALFGMVNIHSQQAESLRRWFAARRLGGQA